MTKAESDSTFLDSIKEESTFGAPHSQRESLTGTFNSRCHIRRMSPEGQKSLSDEGDVPSLLVIVGKSTQANEKLINSIKTLGIPFKFSLNGLDYIHKASNDVIFVSDDFESDVFHRLYKAEARIVGPPIVIDCAQNNKSFPFSARPLYNNFMHGHVICFTGFKERSEMLHMADLVHYMSGSIRRGVNYKVTHLVANCTSGDKYRYAVSYHIPIVRDTWVNGLWEKRDSGALTNTDEQMRDHYVKPFYKCCLSFYGFSPDEQKHMEDATVANGGTVVSTGSASCTHLVIEDHTVKDLPSFPLPHFVVRTEWFWASIQIAACAEERLLSFKKADTEEGHFTPVNISGSKSRKRKRLKENIAQLVAEGENDAGQANTRRRSSDYGALSMSPNSFLDASGTPDKSLQDSAKDEKTGAKPSRRLQVVTELLQTEKNYCSILNTLLKSFKEEIENSPYCDSILKPQEIKLIFGNIPPIYEVHCAIRDDLCDLISNWREDHCVADVFLKQADKLLKIYPPFVNFYDKTKETIESCEKTNQRFHAFLKVCFSKPECGRQTLPELMIWPVQRLPRIILLLTDIMKHTSKTSLDAEKLDKAIDSLKEVMTNINEKRRKAEGQMAMFDMFNDIDNCPPDLLSSHRDFIMKIDVIEANNSVLAKGSHLTIFLFSDLLEICKRRTRVLTSSSTVSPSHRTPRTPHKPAPKAYKHLECMSIENIKRILDVVDSTDEVAVFSLICRNNFNDEDRLYVFVIDSLETTKSEVLNGLAKTMGICMCRTDYESFISQVESKAIDIDMSEIANSSIRKAKRFGKRVSRVFTFNRTPRMKRAISNVSTAFIQNQADPNQTTPISHLRDRRMASTMDLSDVFVSPYVNMSESASDTVSLGGISFRDGAESPLSKIRKSPAIRKLTKYMTLGPTAAKKYL